MDNEKEVQTDPEPNSKSIPACVVLGPIIGSSIGLIGGLLFENMVWGMTIGFSIGTIGGLLWGFKES